MPLEEHVYRALDRVQITEHKYIRFRDLNSIVRVDAHGRQGTINTLMPVSAGEMSYRIHVDIKDAEIVPVQALERGVLEVCLTRLGFHLLEREKNGASGAFGWCYRRPLHNYKLYELMYDGSMASAWDPKRKQYVQTLEQRCATDQTMLGALCGECDPNACSAQLQVCLPRAQFHTFDNISVLPGVQGRRWNRASPSCVWRSPPTSS